VLACCDAIGKLRGLRLPLPPVDSTGETLVLLMGPPQRTHATCAGIASMNLRTILACSRLSYSTGEAPVLLMGKMPMLRGRDRPHPVGERIGEFG
jgi:hypothetical protein